MGVLTFGMIIANKKSYWGASVGFAMLGFGLTAASNVVVTYAVDGYRPVSFNPSQLLNEHTDLPTHSDRRRSLGDSIRRPECHGLHPLTLHSGLDQS